MHLTTSVTYPTQPDDLDIVVGDSDSYHGHLVAIPPKEEVVPTLL